MEHARRLELGQWFTPPAVADLALALALPSDRGRARVLDPACGDGVFLVRAHAAGIAAERLDGIELDPSTAAAARARVPGCHIALRDFFVAAPRHSYDAVVGNPPYVRQERIGDAAKRRVRVTLQTAYPDAPASLIDRVTGRGDLAAAFVAAALAALAPGGRAALVVSSAMLDAGYAAALWQLIAPLGQVIAVVEAPTERWFADAAVNAIILVLERGGHGQPVAIGRLTVPTAEAADRVRTLADLPRVAEIRLASADRPAEWATALRAPSAWFDVAGVAGTAIRPLGAMAEVRRGVTSGANEVFYLRRARATALGLEQALLAPLVRSPKAGGERIVIEVDHTPFVALVAPAARELLLGFPEACRYLEAAAGAAARPTLAARSSWWALPAHTAQVFLTKAYHTRFVQRFAARPVVADQRLYAIHPHGDIDLELLAAVMNSSFTAFALESLGRASLGEGALEWTVADAARLPVIDPAALPPAARRAARVAFRALSRRVIGTVFEERERPDRLALDQALAGAAPGLADLLPALHEALTAKVLARTRRARS